MKKINVACIIDDDPIFVRVVQKMIELVEFCNEVKVFPNGKEARNHISDLEAERLPDIIFLDLNMPVMNGWEFLESLTEMPPHQTPLVYVVSSTIDPEEKERARSYPMVLDFIEKPLTASILNEILFTLGIPSSDLANSIQDPH